jgi:hypothetical protein
MHPYLERQNHEAAANNRIYGGQGTVRMVGCRTTLILRRSHTLGVHRLDFVARASWSHSLGQTRFYVAGDGYEIRGGEEARLGVRYPTISNVS